MGCNLNELLAKDENNKRFRRVTNFRGEGSQGSEAYQGQDDDHALDA